MNNNRSVVEMLGEFCREAAVLLAVFIPLEQVVTHSTLTLETFAFTFLFAGLLLVLGIHLEVTRDD
jgi:hypothetical protein